MPQNNHLERKEIEFTAVSIDEHGAVKAQRIYRAYHFVEKLDNDVALELVTIPGGAFLMGSAGRQGYADEHPQRQVTIAPFLMAKYQVTQEQWQLIMGKSPARFKGARRPVENVSWEEANHFCARLSARSGRSYCLPSEAQWEYACRAQTTPPFSFGETLTTDVANYNGEFIYGREPKGFYRHETTDVGAFPPNAFGLFDMHGNVWEWCADPWHGNYQGAPIDERVWDLGGKTLYRVARGGSWHDTPNVCRCAVRLQLKANEGDEFVGFRVAGSSLIPSPRSPIPT